MSGTASSKGSFTDTFADQIVATIVTIGWMLMRNNELATLSGATYIFSYTLVVAMSMVRNALSIHMLGLSGPRFFIYLTIATDLIWATNWTLPALWIANSLLALKCLSGFLKLRRGFRDQIQLSRRSRPDLILNAMRWIRYPT